MPIYEYYCENNNKIYSFLIKSPALRSITPQCPDHPEFTLQKTVSQFAFISKVKETPVDDPFHGMNDHEMERVMQVMEQELSGFENQNPHPKEMGNILQRMNQILGDRVPKELQEISRRLQAGEDPDQIDADFSAANSQSFSEFLKQTKIKLRGTPLRDPKIYDIEKYLPSSLQHS
jgi:hypothetical protein